MEEEDIYEENYNEEPIYHSYSYNLPSKGYDWDDYDAEEE